MRQNAVSQIAEAGLRSAFPSPTATSPASSTFNSTLGVLLTTRNSLAELVEQLRCLHDYNHDVREV